MKKFLFLLLIIPAFAQAQYDSTRVRQDINTYGYQWKNGKFTGSLIMPSDTVAIAVKDSGAVAAKNGILYTWTGYKWNAGGGGSSQNLQQVTDIGSVTTHKITAANLNLTGIQEYGTLADAVTAGLSNGDIYSLPYNNGNYGLAIVRTAILAAILLENNQSLQTESGQTLILE